MMRKFLLSSIAMLMSIAMMAVGTGDGLSQSNAIDFDWDSVYMQEAPTSWYRIKLTHLNEEAEDPTVALYLTNPNANVANVELTGSAVLKFSWPISMVLKQIDLMEIAGNSTVNFNIEGKKHEVWTLPTTYDLSAIEAGQARTALEQLFPDLSKVSLIQLVEYGLNEVYLKVATDNKIAVASDVYETSEIIEDACTKAVDFDWDGVTVPAGEKWFYLDLNEVKNTDKKLNFVVENNGGVDATVAFDLYGNCPASALLLDYDWVIPAGAEKTEALGRFFLDQMKKDFVYLKLTTDQEITLKAEEEVLPPPVELFNPTVAPVLAIGQEYSINGVKVLQVNLNTLKAPKGYKTVCRIENNNANPVNLKQEIAFSTPVTSNNVQEKNLLVVADTTIEISSKMIGNVKSDVVYFRLTTADELTLVIEHEQLEISKPSTPSDPSTPSTPSILAPTCEDAHAFDWNSTITQKALMTKWYELDLTSLKQNEEHVQLSFTNHTEYIVLVMGSVLRDCGSTDTIPFICPVPAGKQMSKVLDYSLLAASPVGGKAYVSVTMMPTSAKSLAEFASVRSQADLMKFVSLDFGASIEFSARKISALVDPTLCETTHQTLATGVEYNLEAGKTNWFKVTDEFLKNDLNLLQKLTIINKGVQTANVTFGVTVDCQYGIATTIDQTVPTWFDLTTYYPNGLFRLVDALVAEDITEFYLSITTDQPMLFGFDLDYETTLGCDEATRFDWSKGAVINSRDAKWFDFDLTDVKGTGKHVKLTFTNHTDEIVWVASAVSLTCPFKAVVPAIVPVLPGMSVDKTIDYSFVAAPAVDNVYVAVLASGQIELTSTLIDATVEEPVNCINHIEVESGVKYIHQPGTTWYKFTDALLEGMGEWPRISFENLSNDHIKLTAGVTVDCEYGILTKYKGIIPGEILDKPLHHREFAVRIPREFFTAARKLVDKDVTEFMLQLTSDNKFSWSIDKTDDGCKNADPFLWEGCFDLKADENKWFEVNLDTLDKLESLSVMLYKEGEADVTIEAEASPVCPMMLSITEGKTISFEDSLGVTLSPEYLKEKVVEYGKYIGKNNTFYVRIKSNSDLTVCVNAIPCVGCDTIDDPCATIQDLNWTAPISLKSLLKGQLYKLDITSLLNLSESAKKRPIKLTIDNDLEKQAMLVTSLHADCEDTTSLSTSTQIFDFAQNTRRVPYANFENLLQLLIKQLEALQNAVAQPKARALAPNPTKMYLKVVDLKTIDEKPCDATTVTDQAICVGDSYEWRGNVYTETGVYTDVEVLECGEITYTLNLVVTDKDYSFATDDQAICVGDSYEWRGNVYTETGIYTDVEVLECGEVTYTLNLVVTDKDYSFATDDQAICVGDSYVWRGNVYTETGVYTDVEVLECGEVTYTLNLTVNACPPCEKAELVSWKDPFFFEANTDKWYKVDVAGVDAGRDLKFTVVNRDQAQTISIEYAFECPYLEEDLGGIKSVFGVDEYKYYTVSAEKLQATGADEYIYVHIITEGKAIAYAYPTPPCDDAEWINWYDPIRLEGKMNKWYKMDVASAIDAEKDVPITIINGNAENTVVIEYALECPYLEEDLAHVVKDVEANETSKHIITANQLAASGAYDPVYVHIVSKGAIEVDPDVEPCNFAEPLTVDCGASIHLEANTDKWYVLDVAAIAELDDDVKLVVENGSVDNTITVEYGVDCPTDPWTNPGKPYTILANAKDTALIKQEDLDKAGVVDYVYVHITTTGKLTASVVCCPTCYEYKTIKETICDGETYVDPITGEGRVIASIEPFTLTWQDTVVVGLDCVCDTIYTFEITPIVAPDVATVEMLAGVPGATPVLKANEQVDVTGTAEAIKKFYNETKDNGTKVVAEVEEVVWTSGADAMLDCEATTHTMTLLLNAGCNFKVEATLVFPVQPVDKDQAVEKPTIYDYVCDGDEYISPITKEAHIISSMMPASQTWQDVVKGKCTAADTIYTFVITPKVAPVVLTEALLATIADALPVLEAGKKVDVTASEAAIKAFYAGRDTEKISDITKVEWQGANTTLDCEATSHTMTLVVEAECGFSTQLPVNFDVTPATVTETELPAIPVTICENELPYQWSVAGTTVTCDKAGTHKHPVVDGCATTIHVLELTVNKVTETVLSPVKVTVCETELPYTWTVVEGVTVTCDKADTYKYTVDGDCSKTTHVLELTVNKVETTELNPVKVGVCESELPYTWTVVEGVTVTCDKADTYKYTVDGDCSKTTHVLELTVYPTPADVVEYDTICPGETLDWNGLTCNEADTYTTTVVNENGCEYQATLHLYIADADNDPAYDNLDAVGKYGDRLLLLNLNKLNELVVAGTVPAVPAAADVTWYRVVEERDLISDILNNRGNDKPMENSHSYYYNNPNGSPLDAGKYYVLMKLPATGDACDIYLRSVEVELGQSESLAPQLIPTLADPRAELRILNLNPSNVTEVRVFNTSGELIETHTASQASEFIFKAATMQGYYMVEVQSENDKVTLRYIVK